MKWKETTPIKKKNTFFFHTTLLFNVSNWYLDFFQDWQVTIDFITELRSNLTLLYTLDVPTNYQSLSSVTTTKYELSFETTKRDIEGPDSTNYTNRISTTASTYLNNESGNKSNNGTDQNANNENGENVTE